MKRSVICALMFLVLGFGSAAAQIVVGPPDDTTVIADTTGGLSGQLPLDAYLPAYAVSSAGAGDVSMSGLDCSGFPTICFYVDVLDSLGATLSGLTPDSFCVYQDGVPIDSFSVQQLDADSCVTSVCMVVDISGSMDEDHRLDSTKAAMHRFVDNMDPFDRVAIVSFSSCVNTEIGFTSDTAALHAAINGLSASGFTAAFDGIWRGVDLTTSELGSKAVIAFTDGLDNRSGSCWPPPDGVGSGWSPDPYTDDSTIICNLANSAGIPIFTFNVGPITNTFYNPEALQAFAYGTGGFWSYAPTSADIDSIYTIIKERICSRYYICYESLDTVQNGDFHTTTVCYSDGVTCAPCDSSSCQETDPPDIDRTPPTIALGDTCQDGTSALSICAYVTDLDTPTGSLIVNLFYRTSGGSYTSIAMTNTSDSTFCASIPAPGACHPYGVDYYITASDGAATVSSPATTPQTAPYHISICGGSPPVVSCPGLDTVAVCNLDSLCVDGFSVSDPDGDIATVTASTGTYQGTEVCFVPAAGLNSITLIATDSCGQADTCQADVFVLLNQAPVAICPGDDTLFVCDLSQICVDGFSATDADGNLMSTVVSNGTLTGSEVCFTPVAGTNQIMLVATDSCGAADTCVTNIVVYVNSAPVAACPANDTVFVCDLLSQICVDGFSATDVDGNLTLETVSNGTLTGTEVCFTPTAGDNQIMYVATDSCGVADTCLTTIHVVVNTAPVATCPGDDTLFVCDLSQLCVSGFGGSDVDGNLATVAVSNGTLNSGDVCFTPVVGANVITLIATDSCGLADTCETTVYVELNSPPTVACANDTSFLVNDLSPICLTGFGYSDADGNIASAVVTGGTLSGDTVCFTPVIGLNTISIVVTDSCGAADTCTTFVVIGQNSPPQCTLPTTDTTFSLCAPVEVCLPASALDTNNNLVGCQIISGPGTLTGSDWCYTPAGNEVDTVTIRCTDSLGLFCEETIIVTFEINSAPVATCPGDDTLFVCDLSALCLPGFGAADADGNLVSTIVTGGTLSGDTVCFTPVEGANVITLVATDACGLADTCQTTIYVDLNEAPVATCAGNDTLFVCDLNDICLAGFGATDADGNLVSTTVTGGTLSNDTVCFTPVMGNNLITLIATDACGLADTCETTIYIDVNNPPVATCPGNDTLFVCDLSDICIDGFSTSDPDGNLVSSTATGGTLTGTEICFTPVAGDNTLMLVATDVCGAADTCVTTIHVVVNAAPVASCPGDDTLFVCDLSDICVDGFSASDPDGNLQSTTAQGGALNGTEICFTPVAGNNVLTLIATDSCGVADTCTTTIVVAVNSPPVVNCPSNVSMFVCDLSDICIDGFTCSDSDGNIELSSVTGGTLTGTEVCFTPVAGDNTIIYSCTDSCGATVACTTVVSVTVNSAPVAACPPTDSLFVCDLSDICIDGFTASDPDANLASTSATGGTLNGTEICFTPVMGNNILTFIAVDSCGLADTCQTTIYVASNNAPTATCPAVPAQFACDPGGQLCVDGFTCDDADGNCDTAWATVGTLTGSTICFVPTAGSNTIGFVCLDSCGAADTCEVTFDVVFNSPPVVTCPTIDTQFVCDLSQLCVSGFQATDVDNNLASTTVNGQAYTIGGQYCFTPVAGSNALVFIAVDSCGAADTCTILVPVSLNSPPTVSCPPVDTAFVCDLGQLCIDGFACSDPDGNIAGSSAVGGTVNGSQVCIANPVAGANAITYICTDSCGAADTCQTSVYVVVNQPPTASCPGPDTVFVCNPGQVCLDGFGAVDPDGNIASRTVSAGTLNGSQVCLNTSAGLNNITYIVTDSCGVADTCQTFVFVQPNRPPVVNCPSIDTIRVCDYNASICINGFTTSDLDNNEDFCTINGQPFNPTGAYCFVPVPGTNTLTFECTDLCGAAAQCVLQFEVVDEDPTICTGCPDIVIEKVHEVIQGGYQNVSVNITDLGFDIGAFDVLIQYDASALSFTSASRGQFLQDCGWEYFQYRNGASGNCGTSSCPSGVLRVAAIADMNNGPAHPSCLQPVSGDGELIVLRFLVTNDRTLECTYVPIRFIWYDCGDNTISNPAGDNLYISNEVYDYYVDGNYIAITDPNAAFPSPFGANTVCDTALGDGKPDPIPCIDFYNGGIDIACADSLDARGDENLNEIANEVADVVLFSRYFIYGFSVFTINMQGQIAATDVNADGLALSVADLVYQIRIVVGDADPFPKLAPVNIEYGKHGGRIWVDAPIGAAFMTVAGQITPTLHADKMDMQYSYDAENNNTRILIFGMDQGDQFKGEFVDIEDGELLSIEMATYDGSPVTAKLVPSTYALHQNYPNPFNPTTVISFALPQQSEYTVTIFSATGQTVKEFSGSAEAGEVQLEWDASSAPSGMYFYRLQAGNFSDTKKMVLLK